MKIESNVEPRRRRRFSLILRSEAFRALLIYNGILLILALVVYKDLSDVRKLTIRNKVSRFVDQAANKFSFWKSEQAPTRNVEYLMIGIKHVDYQKLAYKRQQAVERGVLLKGADDWVPAKLEFGDGIHDAKLRLKGRLEDHWNDREIWSLKVELKGSGSYLGMNSFTIQHPKTRDYVNEWTFHKLLKHAGLIALRYDFIEISINGKQRHIYAIEEDMEKRLIEQNRRREGLILKFNSNYDWASFGDPTQHQSIDYYTREVSLFQGSKYLQSEESQRQFEKAVTLLDGFRSGELKTSDVFDGEQLAKFFAICDLVGYHHATHLQNIRFYYNPITSRLEPIGRDNQHVGLLVDSEILGAHRSLGEPLEGGHHLDWPWLRTCFMDVVFYKQYVEALQEVSAPGFLEAFWKENEQAYHQNVHVLRNAYLEYDGPPHELKALLEVNRKFLVALLERPKKMLQTYVRQDENGKIDLVVLNSFYCPVELKAVRIGHQLIPLSNQILNAYRKRMPDYVDIPLGLEVQQEDLEGARVTYGVLGGTETFEEAIYPWSHTYDTALIQDALRRESNLQEYDFLAIEGERIRFKKGSWKLTAPLIIGKGYKLMLEPGFELEIGTGGFVVSRSPAMAFGTEQEGIRIYGDGGGGGVFFSRAEGESRFEHVTFEGMKNPQESHWSLTGMVNFHESPVRFRNCRFANSKCEDAVNIIRTRFSIDSCVFFDSQSDAFDGDFVEGEVANSVFLSSGNDAIDVSGSSLKLRDVRIDKAGDKALSAGEATFVDFESLTIKNCEIGVVSKDHSVVEGDGVVIEDTKVGFSAYQKKSEFGGGEVSCKRVKTANLQELHMIEIGSKLVLEGVEIRDLLKEVKEDFYGTKYGKSSK